MAEIVGDESPALQAAAEPSTTTGVFRNGSAWTVALLGLIAMLSSIDRQSFSAMLTPMKKELQVSDAMMGLLTGSAATLVYAIVALPLARLIDRTHRRNLLAIAVAIWSIATAACGFAVGFFQLLLARVVVGSAESGQMPASMSLVGDMFSARSRGAAVGVVYIGSALGFALGAALAGTLAESYGWRVALMVVGAPGVLLALLFFLSVREPVRGAQDGPGHTDAKENILQCLKRLSRIRTIYPFGIGWVLMGACNAGWLVWGQTLYVRVHHLTNAQAGQIFGSTIAFALFATLLGGPLTDFLSKRGSRWRMYYCFFIILLAAPVQAASVLAPTPGLAQLLMILYTLISGALTTVTTATYVSFSPPTMRAFMTAFMALCAAVLGGGGAPFLYGFVNDILTKTYGDQALRYTLLLSPGLLFLAGLMFLLSSRTLDRDVAAAAVATEAA